MHIQNHSMLASGYPLYILTPSFFSAFLQNFFLCQDRLSGDVPPHLAQPCYVALGWALILGLYPDLSWGLCQMGFLFPIGFCSWIRSPLRVVMTPPWGPAYSIRKLHVVFIGHDTTINTGYSYESIRIGPSGIQTHDLSIMKPTRCQLCHHGSVPWPVNKSISNFKLFFNFQVVVDRWWHWERVKACTFSRCQIHFSLVIR